MGNPFHRGPYAYGTAGGSAVGFIARFEDGAGSVLYPEWEPFTIAEVIGDAFGTGTTLTVDNTGLYRVEWRGYVHFIWGQDLIFGIAKNGAPTPMEVGRVNFASETPAFVFKNFTVQAVAGDAFTLYISTSFEYGDFSYSGAQVGGYIV